MKGAIPFVPLREVAEINPPLPVKVRDDENVAFIPMAAVNETRTDVVEAESRPFGSVKKGYTPFVRNDVLVAKITPCFENGKIALASLIRHVGCGSTEFHVLRARPTVLDARYLVHFLRQSRIRHEGERRMTGSGGQRRVPADFVASLKVPLPSLSEQRCIAAILDQADAVRAKRQSALAQLPGLLESVFLDMFGDPATNARGWPMAVLGEVADVVSGATPKTDVQEYWDGSICWITPRELSGLSGIYVSTTERRISEAGLRSCAASVLPSGAVLFSSRAPIGHTAICSTPMATNQGFKSFVPMPGTLDGHFLLYWLRLRRSFLEGLGTGATFKEVSKAVVSRVPLILPPIQLQQRFAQVAAKVEELHQVHASSLSLMDDAFSAIQQWAFLRAD